MKRPRPDWREPRPQLDLDDWLHAQANKLPWPGRLVRKRKGTPQIRSEDTEQKKAEAEAAS